jgi:hypothetical protein
MAVDDDKKDDDDAGGTSWDSTIVRHGKEAFLLAEMGRFSRELTERPLRKLIEDLPGLLDLPESKYALVALTLKKRMRASEIERDSIATELQTLRERSSETIRSRCEALLHVV